LKFSGTEHYLSYRALHLRFEKGMVGLSFCDFVGTRDEKARMGEYRKKEWPRRYKVSYQFSGFSLKLEQAWMIHKLLGIYLAERFPSMAVGPAKTEGRKVPS